jgi:HlyD family secretion protein
MNTGIFRKKSLEQLSSPERLDELMQVTSSRLWIAGSTLALLVLFALVWGVFGTIATKVQGQGVLLKSGGLFMVSSLGSGKIDHINVQVGDVVEAGQVVANIEMPALTQQLSGARKDVEEIGSEAARRAIDDEHETELSVAALESQKSTLKQMIGNLNDQSKWLSQQVVTLQKLLDQGLITRQTLVSTQQELEGLGVRVSDTTSQISQLSLQQLQLQNGLQQRKAETQMRRSQAERSARQLEESLKLSANVVTPYRGRVIEVMAHEQDLVHQGSPLVNIELVGEKLTAVVYIPATEGKRVEAGMKIQISPTTVKKERYGVMLGRVESVSEFPSSSQAMSAVLNNEALINLLAAQGAQFAVKATLELDPKTESGFAWSSSRGPPVQVTAGTLCDASVVVEQQAPITMVVPFLKGWLGL